MRITSAGFCDRRHCSARATSSGAALIHVFFAERETRKIPEIPADLKGRPVKQAAIVGAGTMGGGIAICFANAGIPVTLIDVAPKALDRGIKVIAGNYANTVKRGRLTADDVATRMVLGGATPGQADPE